MTLHAGARYDLVAVGGGTAGLVATRGVAGLGGRAALIEVSRTGGDCLWNGCVPSKALLAVAATAHRMRTADRHGIGAVEPDIDPVGVMRVVRVARAAVAPHDAPDRLGVDGVDVIAGRGRFVGPGLVQVGDRTVGYRTALVATGSRPVLPSVDGLDAAEPLTTDSFWELERLPASLVVLGGGPSGCELAQATARLGATVTLVEARASLLPGEPPDLGRLLARRLEDEGVVVRTAAAAVSVGPEPAGGWAVDLADGTVARGDRILVVAGRRPATDGLGLDTVGVAVDERGAVVVDRAMRTTGDRIYAAGDVTGAGLTHVAGHQARHVVTNALWRTRRSLDPDRVPRVVLTDPEIARVGLDAEAARDRWGERAVVRRFDHAGLDRALVEGRTTGWTELVGDPRRHLAGATVVGPRAGESIAEVVAWMTAGRRIDDVSTAVHAYPTFAEGAARAADDVLRDRYLTPQVRRATAPLLALLRRIDRPRS